METEQATTLIVALRMIGLTLSLLMLGSLVVAAVSGLRKRFGLSVPFWRLTAAFSAAGLLTETIQAQLQSTQIASMSIFWCVLTVACSLFNARMDARQAAKSEPSDPS